MAELDFWDKLGQELNEFFGDPYKAGVLSATDADVVFMDPSEINSPEDSKKALEDHEPGLTEKLVDYVSKVHPNLSSDEIMERLYETVEKGAPYAMNVPGTNSCVVLEPGPDYDSGRELLSGISGNENYDSSHLDGDDVVWTAGAHEGVHCEQNGPYGRKEETEADESALRGAVERGSADAAEALWNARREGAENGAPHSHRTHEDIDIGSILGPPHEHSHDDKATSHKDHSNEDQDAIKERAAEGVGENPEIHGNTEMAQAAGNQLGTSTMPTPQQKPEDVQPERNPAMDPMTP